MAVNNYSIGGYWWLLVAILLTGIGCYSMDGYRWIFYWWIVVLLNGYYINAY